MPKPTQLWIDVLSSFICELENTIAICDEDEKGGFERELTALEEIRDYIEMRIPCYDSE